MEENNEENMKKWRVSEKNKKNKKSAFEIKKEQRKMSLYLEFTECNGKIVV